MLSNDLFLTPIPLDRQAISDTVLEMAPDAMPSVDVAIKAGGFFSKTRPLRFPLFATGRRTDWGLEKAAKKLFIAFHAVRHPVLLPDMFCGFHPNSQYLRASILSRVRLDRQAISRQRSEILLLLRPDGR